MTLLCARDLSVSIGGAPIIGNVTLDVNPGEILALVGESGSGKSTTVLAMLDLLPPGARMSGSVTLDSVSLPVGDDQAMCAIRGREIGFVSQEPMTALNPLMTIGDQVAETLRQHCAFGRKEAHAHAAATLERVAMPADRFPLSRFPHEISGGQRQRVAIAMALAASPKVLLADEPTTALDVTTQAKVLELLKSLVSERNMGLVLVTHDLGVVAEVADRVAIMQAGSIVEQGPALEIFREMKHSYSRKLMDATRHIPVRATGPAKGEPPVLLAEKIVRYYAGARRGFFRRDPDHIAVNGVNVELARGETLAIVGESGSGKSTLLRTLLALDKPQSGTVTIKGSPFAATLAPRELRKSRQEIQAVFQDPYGSFDPRWRVERIVAEPLTLAEHSVSAEERRRRVAAALERVGLKTSDGERYPHEFSGGQRQRIAIARALIVEPSIMALDEAVSALDVSVRAQILDLLASLADETGMAYLFVTHDLSVVRAIADRVLVMRGGEIVEQGKTRQIFEAPAHSYTRELIAATPIIETALQKRAQQQKNQAKDQSQ
jgi:peptide/nickel transport system ATP-binding protein